MLGVHAAGVFLQRAWQRSSVLDVRKRTCCSYTLVYSPADLCRQCCLLPCMQRSASTNPNDHRATFLAFQQQTRRLLAQNAIASSGWVPAPSHGMSDDELRPQLTPAEPSPCTAADRKRRICQCSCESLCLFAWSFDESRRFAGQQQHRTSNPNHSSRIRKERTITMHDAAAAHSWFPSDSARRAPSTESAVRPKTRMCFFFLLLLNPPPGGTLFAFLIGTCCCCCCVFCVFGKKNGIPYGMYLPQRARKQKLQRLFKQGVSRVVRERAEEMDLMAKKGSLYVMDAFAGR